MLKPRVDRLFFTVIAVPLDFAVIVLAGLLAWSLRFSPFIQGLRPVSFGIKFSHYFILVLIVGLFMVIALAVAGLYRFPRLGIGNFRLFLRIVLATSSALTLIALVVLFSQQLFDSRFLLLAGWILATFFLLLERGFLNFFERFMARRFGLGLKNALVVGRDGLTADVLNELNSDVSNGLRVSAKIESPNLPQLKNVVSDKKIDTIILADPNYTKEEIIPLVDFVNEKHLSFFLVPNVFQILTANASVGLLGDIPVVELKRTRLEGWGRVTKRVMDFVGALFAVVIFALPMAIIALLVKINDPNGPVIYRNRRAGEKGQPFWTLKFRSMKWEYSTGPGAPNPEKAIAYEKELAQKQSTRKGPVWKILNDPRRTAVGRFLERTSLDELPQFFNVLKGEMSLVGPRPHMLEQVENYAKEHKRVLAIKPGITGLAQVSGRSDLDFEDEVRLDTFYLENWSLWLDLRIIFLTPFAVLFKRHHS